MAKSTPARTRDREALRCSSAGIGEGASPSGPLKSRIQTHLKQMIEGGRIRPGERLLESRIAKVFEVSRSPARQALAALAADGLLAHDEAHGFRVSGDDGSAPSGIAELDPVPISQARRWETIYSEVEQALYANILRGPVRINELRLAQQYDVSRTVTRDLLARMHGVGLITKDPSGHWTAPRVTPARIRNLYELRQLLEPAMLMKAAPHVPAALLGTAFRRVEEALSTLPPTSAQFDQIETDLHIEILSFCGSNELIHALAPSRFLFGPTRHLVDPVLGLPVPMIEAALSEHLRILRQLLAKDASNAATLLRTHLSDAVARWTIRFERPVQGERASYPTYMSPFGSAER